MLYKIGEFAKMAQINPKQLKYYEQCGLITPIEIDRTTGYRFYGAEQLKTVAHIRAFLSMEFTTAEIKSLLAGQNYEEAFAAKEEQVARELTMLREKAAQLRFYKEILKADAFNQDYRIGLKTTPGGMAVVRDAVCADAEDLLREWESFDDAITLSEVIVWEEVGPWTRFPGEEVKFEDFRAELICFVRERGKDSEFFQYCTLNPMKVAGVIHRGNYEFLNEAYAFLYMWIDKSGHKPCGAPMERYIAGPSNQEDPRDWITEVCVPIE